MSWLYAVPNQTLQYCLIQQVHYPLVHTIETQPSQKIHMLLEFSAKDVTMDLSGEQVVSVKAQMFVWAELFNMGVIDYNETVFTYSLWVKRQLLSF